MSDSILKTAMPRLIVRDADAAIAFYRTAFGADLAECHTDPGGRIVFAQLAFAGSGFVLSEEVAEWGWVSPSSLGGSPVLFLLDCRDCDRLAAAMVGAGAEVVIEIADRDYGRREGRLRDPFGHLWTVSAEVSQ